MFGKRNPTDAERQRLEAMQGRTDFRVHFTRELAAAALWDYAEDKLVARMLEASDEELRLVQNIAAAYEDPDYALPIDGRITHNHVTGSGGRDILRDPEAAEPDTPTPRVSASTGTVEAGVGGRSDGRSPARLAPGLGDRRDETRRSPPSAGMMPGACP